MATKVERYIAQARQRFDAFGFGDVLAVHPERGILLAQVTSGSNVASRATKISTECRVEAMAWLSAGGLICVMGWRRVRRRITSRTGRDMGKRLVWRPRITSARLSESGELVWIEVDDETYLSSQGRR